MINRETCPKCRGKSLVDINDFRMSINKSKDDMRLECIDCNTTVYFSKNLSNIGFIIGKYIIHYSIMALTYNITLKQPTNLMTVTIGTYETAQMLAADDVKKFISAEMPYTFEELMNMKDDTQISTLMIFE